MILNKKAVKIITDKRYSQNRRGIMNDVKVGIIGIGNMGSAHLDCIYKNEIEGMRVTAVCDTSPERCEYVRKTYSGVAVFENDGDFFANADIDAVIVATPHKYHAELGIIALEHGLHLLVEKPEDVSVTNAHKLNVAAKRSGKVFGIMFNQRTNPLFAKARELVKSGSLGGLRRSVWIVTNWYRTQSYYNSGGWRATWNGEGGGVLLNQAPHNLDLWQWICGMPETITAFCDVAKYHKIEVEDDVTIFARYPGGATGTFLTSTGEFPGTNRLEISGDLGKLVLENGKMKWWRLERSVQETIGESTEMSASIPMKYTEIVPDAPETAHRGILQNFSDAVRKGTPLLAPGEEGVNELMISNAAYCSSWNGNMEIKLPLDAENFDELLSQHIKQHSESKAAGKSEQNHGYSKRWQVCW